MSTAPNHQPADNPRGHPHTGDYSPTPTEMLRIVRACIRGFHWHREKPKVTDVAMAVLTLLVALAAFWSAWIFDGQLGEMHKSNEQARTQWEAEHRPWVGNGEIGFKQPPVFLAYLDNPIQARTQITFDIEIPIKNFGVTPALHVQTGLLGTMTSQIASPPTIDTMMESACGSSNSDTKRIGGVLFPNGPETRTELPMNIMVPFIHVAEVRRVWLAICVVYGSSNSSEPLHHTKIWMASWPINGQPVEIRRTNQPKVIYYSLPIPQWGIIRTEAD
ncbi:MAG TPA: hypothetical protein VK829_13540 [Terriglobales bacterium]|nr:hypothetical protein [Terriglobales bacterium]